MMNKHIQSIKELFLNLRKTCCKFEVYLLNHGNPPIHSILDSISFGVTFNEYLKSKRIELWTEDNNNNNEMWQWGELYERFEVGRSLISCRMKYQR